MTQTTANERPDEVKVAPEDSVHAGAQAPAHESNERKSKAVAEEIADTEESARATSFGTFKPVGHVMVGLPSRQALIRLKAALRAPGAPGLAADELTPIETEQEMQALIDNASPLAGFGYEITLMRRYLELARQGYSWLVVKSESDDEARLVGELAKAQGATLAVRYGWLTVEDMI